MSLGTTGANAALNGLPNTVYLGLNTGAPGTTGANEATGYTRQALTLGAAASGSRANSNAISSFAPPTGQALSNYSYWDSATVGQGNFILGGVLATTKTYGSGDTASVAAGAFITTAS